jgi:uncharacterized protein YgiM (DUF1202 family)
VGSGSRDSAPEPCDDRDLEGNRGADPVVLNADAAFSIAGEWRLSTGLVPDTGSQEEDSMSRYVVLSVLLFALVACGASATPTPDAVATQVAVGRAAAATLTAEAAATLAAETPTATSTSVPSPVPTATATSAPTAVPTSVPTALPTSTPSPTDTRPVPPTSAPPTATPTNPPVGPLLGQFAVVNVASDDVLNVRSGPGIDHPIAGTIPFHGLGVRVYAGGQEVSGSWWVPAQYAAVTGWVNSRYLARQIGGASEAIAARAAQIILALKGPDLRTLAGSVHPDKGVRFSPYTYVRAAPGSPGGQDLVFTAAQVQSLWSDPIVYKWGTAAGSGEAIELTFAGYYDRYIYDVDFARPDVIGFGETVGQGNTINNISEVYPGAVTVEYHFEGFDPQYAGLDWRSLRLVLEPVAGSWYLVGIVHDEWTP